MSQFPILGGKLQGDLNAAGFTINNLLLTGLGLTKHSVGLGNVDNTSDLAKPLSSATIVALAGKEPTIAAGLTSQFWIGNKTWQTFGALALQAGETTLPILTSIGASTTAVSYTGTRRWDYASTFVETALRQYGQTAVGQALTTVGNAGAGVLSFQNTTNAIIMSNGATPLRFGTSSIQRAQILLGLTVGPSTIADPGVGSITASGTINALHFTGTDLVLSGGAIFNDDVVIAGGGNGLTTTGDIEAGGEVVAALGFSTPSTITGGGNMAVVGSIISFSGLPTSDPAVVGRLWNDAGTVKVSV